MLKKLRRKVILSAMAAFFAALLVVSGAILGWYYKLTVNGLDSTIDEIRAVETEWPSPFGDYFLPSLFRGMTRDQESRYGTRYFAVTCDSRGRILSLSMDYIATIDEKTACTYANEAFDTGRSGGFRGDYRWHRYENGTRSRLIFLNASQEIGSVEVLAIVCGAVMVLGLIIAFPLVLLFSSRAVKPTIENAERQKRFITDAGHELKTPLTSISTSADVLAMEHEGDEWVENIREQTKKMGHLVGDLVTLSRLDEELPLPDRMSFSLSEAAWEIAEPFGKQAAACGKTLKPLIDEEAEMAGDRSSIQKLMSVLLDNAVKYADAGAEIVFRVHRSRNRVTVETENACINAKKIDPKRIFDRFYRPDESRSGETGGYGIGLSIARAVTEAHGGSIEAVVIGEDRVRFSASFKAGN